MPKPPQAFWAGKWKAEAAGTASCPLGSPFGRAVTAGDLRGQRGLVTLSGGWRRQLPQRGSQGAGMPPRAIRYGLHPTNCWPARPRTSCRIFVGDDVEGSYESGEPNGLTIIAGLSGSHCLRRHAAESGEPIGVTTSTICQARIVSGDPPPAQKNAAPFCRRSESRVAGQ